MVANFFVDIIEDMLSGKSKWIGPPEYLIELRNVIIDSFKIRINIGYDTIVPQFFVPPPFNTPIFYEINFKTYSLFTCVHKSGMDVNEAGFYVSLLYTDPNGNYLIPPMILYVFPIKDDNIEDELIFNIIIIDVITLKKVDVSQTDWNKLFNVVTSIMFANKFININHKNVKELQILPEYNAARLSTFPNRLPFFKQYIITDPVI